MLTNTHKNKNVASLAEKKTVHTTVGEMSAKVSYYKSAMAS
jgi:hypothetical protein